MRVKERSSFDYEQMNSEYRRRRRYNEDDSRPSTIFWVVDLYLLCFIILLIEVMQSFLTRKPVIFFT